MNYGDFTWEEALAECHKKWLTDGSRSIEKLIPPHQWIKETLKRDLGDEYEYYAKGPTNEKYDKEYKSIKGLLYDKTEDITILKDEKVVGVVSFKFVASNYSQNSNNYYENLLGECFNIQAVGIPFCHVFVTRYKIPYFHDGGILRNYEKFSKYRVDKYIKLKNHESKESVPKKISLSIVNLYGDTLNDDIIHFKDFKELDNDTQETVLENIKVELCDYSRYGEEISNDLNEMEIHKVLEEFADIIRENDRNTKKY